MRYESFPRKIMNGLTSVYRYIKDEFGIWAYVVIVVLVILLYKPFLAAFSIFSSLIMYIIFGGLLIYGLYYLIKKIFKI